MALVDYERAWRELEALVPSKPHHGSRDLALAMQEIAARNAIDETLPERMLRLYGVQVSEDLRAQARDELLDGRRGSSAPAAEAEPGHRHDRGGHDGHDGTRFERERAGAGL